MVEYDIQLGQNRIEMIRLNQTKRETYQMRYPNVTSLYFATHLAFNAPDGGVPL